MPSKRIYVSKDRSKNPIVQVDPKILGKKWMKWRKDSESPEDFDFEAIVFDPPGPFDVRKLTKTKINVKNDRTSGEYEYTITVKCKGDGLLYTTTEQTGGAPAPGDKPVIRN